MPTNTIEVWPGKTIGVTAAACLRGGDHRAFA
jgi:hypothetical protein